MKKTIFVTILMIVLCLAIVGCESKEKEEKLDANIIADGWILIISEKETVFDEDLEKAFEDYSSEKLKPIAILGTQVVAGTNYMFLCETAMEHKVAIVYKDLQGNVQITQVNDFDVKKYINEDNGLETEMLSGGWNTVIPEKTNALEESIQESFDKATEKLIGVTYYPIAILAEQNKSGKNYAIMCYGKLSDQNATTGVFVLTLHVDEENKSEIVSIAAVDLKDYNK